MAWWNPMTWFDGGRRAAGRMPRAWRIIRAKFDAAQTTPDNRRHWANADLLSADAAASAEVRRILRSRSRYEVANNCYAKGIVLTLANDVIGTGPRLQMLADDAEVNGVVEREFARWARAVRLPEKLRTMRMARASDGEAFALLLSNGNLPHQVKLDIRLIEADQVTTRAPPSPRPARELSARMRGHGTLETLLDRRLQHPPRRHRRPLAAASLVADTNWSAGRYCSGLESLGRRQFVPR